MGVAGDMLCGALLDTLSTDDKNEIIAKLNTLVDGVSVSVFDSVKCGIGGTKFDVSITEHHRHHTALSEIYGIIDSFDIPEEVKENAKAIYEIVAKAESKVHRTEVADIHLHEVGAKDAIMDITACCYILNYIGIKEITCSPIVTGFGKVKTAHGILPVPAPATAEILKGIPTENGDIEGELTTPTGAAIVKYFSKAFTANNITATEIGYGMGTKDFEKPNCVRVFIDENKAETVYELRCQIDDMTGEEMGYAINKLMEKGAKDAFVKPIVMKKSRPAFEFTVITSPDKKEELTQEIFKHTTTLGVRQVECYRKTLDREIIEKNGISIKRSELGKEKIEFDHLAKLADEKDISLFEARKLINK